MAPRYYTTPDQHESIEDLVQQVERHAAGELYVANHFRGIKIIYDINTGFLATQSVEAKPGINESFNPKILHPILHPIIMAFSLLAKIELIRSLQQLDDNDVSAIISKSQFEEKVALGKTNHHYFERLFKMLSQPVVDSNKSTLLPLGLFKPKQPVKKPGHIQQAIHDVFTHLERDEQGMLKLESKRRVIEIIEAVKVRAAELAMHDSSEPSLAPKQSF